MNRSYSEYPRKWFILFQRTFCGYYRNRTHVCSASIPRIGLRYMDRFLSRTALPTKLNNHIKTITTELTTCIKQLSHVRTVTLPPIIIMVYIQNILHFTIVWLALSSLGFIKVFYH